MLIAAHDRIASNDEEPVLEPLRGRTWNGFGHTMWRNGLPRRQYRWHHKAAGLMVDIQEHVEKGSGERKIQLEEDGDDSTRQSWMETSVIVIIIVVTTASSLLLVWVM